MNWLVFLVWGSFGGFIIMVSTLMVSVASHYRQEQEKEREDRGREGERERGRWD
jgi:hypothetical protein